MADKLEDLIKAVYAGWKKSRIKETDIHPDEETMGCFLEGRLAQPEAEELREHILSCAACAEALALSLEAESAKATEVPEELIRSAIDILNFKEKPAVLEIFLRLKANMLEVLKTGGDILLGQELVPAALLRSRNIRDFKDEVVILKDFKDVRVEIKIENKAGKYFNATVEVKRKDTAEALKDLRVTLVRDEVELESYLSDTGMVSFEHVWLGKYRLEITSFTSKLASVILDVKA